MEAAANSQFGVSLRDRAVAFRISELLVRADLEGMTQSSNPFVQSLIVLANSRKELLAAALSHARKSMKATAQTPWQPEVDARVEKHKVKAKG